MEKYSNVGIIFNEDNKTAVITYIGNLCVNEDADVYMHCGYGLLWENVCEIQMDKTDCGYMTTIELLEGQDSINCCFRDNNNNWDNNNADNYTFDIEITQEQAVRTEEDDMQEDDEILNSFGKNLSKFFYNIFKAIPQLFKKLSETANRQIDLT